MTEELLTILRKELANLAKSASLLQHAFDKCHNLAIKNHYSETELEAFEVLTARFARLSDFLIQKIFRLIDTIELANEGTVLDRINRAEKKNLLNSATEFTEIRLLRNTIVYEYEPDEYTRIFKDVLRMSPLLLDSVKLTQDYCKKFS